MKERERQKVRDRRMAARKIRRSEEVKEISDGFCSVS